jgi:hypothetical protein
VYEQLTADCYVLASQLGERTSRLIGYAPREFVANARKWEGDGDTYHVVDQEYLYPFVEQPNLNFGNRSTLYRRMRFICGHFYFGRYYMIWRTTEACQHYV